MNDESRLVPVYLGIAEPESWKENGESRFAHIPNAKPAMRPEIADPSIGWAELGLVPRWLESDSSDCPVAIQPSPYAGKGYTDRKRFLEGAKFRNQTALVITWIGDNEKDGLEATLSRFGVSAGLGDSYTSVVGNHVAVASSPLIAPGLSAADRDLGLRISQQTLPRWWALNLHGSTLSSIYGTQEYPAAGTLLPLLVSGVGETLAGIWVSDDRTQRWYVLPRGVDWTPVLDWLITKGLPAMVPDALRRVCSPLFDDTEMQSQRERVVRLAIETLDSEHAARRADLADELAIASAVAEPIRNGLLYEQGDSLVRAVETVLTHAGIATVNLDQEIGTKNADLLASLGDVNVLIEVKGFGGSAPENAIASLQRHLQTWPRLRSTPISGGVLVISHEIKQSPSLRSSAAYRRPEFVNSFQERVVTARDLFNWWSSEDWQAIRDAFFRRPTLEPSMCDPELPSLSKSKENGWFSWKRDRRKDVG
jgi:hypothetical protein